MTEWKIDSNIPIPLEPEEILPEEEYQEESRWIPFKPNLKRCAKGKCYPAIGRCLQCEDVFPCPSGNCGHFDCADPSIVGLDCKGNGTETPDYVIMSESALVSPRSREIEVSEEGSDED